VRTALGASRCRACDFLHAPARAFRCLNCGGRDLEPAEVELRGRLETFTTLRGPDGEERGLALVRLAAGPLVTASLQLNGVPPALGAAVEGWLELAEEQGRPVQRIRFALVPAAPGLATRAAAREVQG
jgi:uncharacterized OB-fold protein